MARIKYIVSNKAWFSVNDQTSYYCTFVTRTSDGVRIAFIPDCDDSAGALVRDTFCKGEWRNLHTIHSDIRTYRQYKYMADGVERCTTSKQLKKLFRDEKKRLQGSK